MYETFFISVIGFFLSVLIVKAWSTKDPYGYDQASKGHKRFLGYLVLSLMLLVSNAGIVGSALLILSSAF